MQIRARFLEARAQVLHKFSPFCQRGTHADSSSLLEAGAQVLHSTKERHVQIAALFLEAGAQVLHSTKGHVQIAARFLEAEAQVLHSAKEGHLLCR